ncbi:MAG: CYTH domain-containing protein [Lentisphaeria bacterium]|nr:CYTH domain-containing protein [Lentisphaeria bacterium]
MAREIERKFLLKDESWRDSAGTPRHLVQGYFETGPGGCTLRVRDDDGAGRLTIKGRPHGFARSEFEYAIPAADVAAMLAEFCASRVVEKLRYLVTYGGFTWEIDEYLGDNAGLFTAEIELPTENTEFPRPSWLGEEVSGVSRYTNGALSRHPYRLWRE